MLCIQRSHHIIKFTHSIARFSINSLSKIWEQCNFEQRENFHAHNHGKYEDHKKFTREMITKMTKDMTDKKIVVYGPGLSEPLQQLASRNMLYLVDQDQLTLKEVSKELPKEKVKLIKYDFTHGLCQQAEEVIKEFKSNSLAESLMSIINLFSKFKFTTTELPQELENVDCAISSNVTSQLSAQVEGVIRRAFRAKYNCDLIQDALIKYPMLTLKYYEAFTVLKTNLPKRHFLDLSKSLKNKGDLYYADSLFAKNRGNITSVPPEALKILHSNFTTLEQNHWEWEAFENRIYIVCGYIMKKA